MIVSKKQQPSIRNKLDYGLPYSIQFFLFDHIGTLEHMLDLDELGVGYWHVGVAPTRVRVTAARTGAGEAAAPAHAQFSRIHRDTSRLLSRLMIAYTERRLLV